jgi:hypothetical protein
MTRLKLLMNVVQTKRWFGETTLKRQLNVPPEAELIFIFYKYLIIHLRRTAQGSSNRPGLMKHFSVSGGRVSQVYVSIVESDGNSTTAAS